MLALVPLLAGAWPSVRLLIEQHNELLQKATHELRDVTHRLSAETNAFKSEMQKVVEGSDNFKTLAIFTATERLAEKASSLTNQIEGRSIQLQRYGALSPWLPLSWAVAFLAALGVTLGHLVYQTRAPDLVRKNSRDGYVSSRRQSFREQFHDKEFDYAVNTARKAWLISDKGSRLQVGLSAALEHRDKQLSIPWESRPYIPELEDSNPPDEANEDIGELYWYSRQYIIYRLLSAMTNLIQESRSWAPNILPLRKRLTTQEMLAIQRDIKGLLYYDRVGILRHLTQLYRDSIAEDPEDFQYIIRFFFDEDYTNLAELSDRAKLDTIGDAAIIEYDSNLHKRIPAMIVSLSFYVGAGILIGILTLWQCRAVLEASGWPISR